MFPLSIPTFHCATGLWSETTFATRSAYTSYLESQFKEPGRYDFDETSLEFNRQARQFQSVGYYCEAPTMTRDFILYWDNEKQRCRKGVIFHAKDGEHEWFLPRDYYWWINFLRIFHKEKKRYEFAEIRDAQYHMALYEELAENTFKHCAILKKRQIASSFFHAAKMLNRFWFEEGFINKMAGTLKSYINAEGTWRFLEEYRNHLNEHTAWVRPCTPDKVLNWQQQVELKLTGGAKIMKGLKSVIMGLVLDKDVTNGVGGPCGLFFHEEAGIAPKMNKTLEFLLPALKSGLEYTGMFVAAGSVGELDQCEPLREMLFRPGSKDVLAVKTNLLDSKGSVGECALFIPEQWSMVPYVDKFGNSVIEAPTPAQVPHLLARWIDAGKDPADFDPTMGALKAIAQDRAIQKREKSAADYQLYVSQHPINIEEAFAARTKSIFPLHLVSQQIERIKAKEYYLDYRDIARNLHGKPEWKKTKRLPISEFPFKASSQDKEGAIVVHEDYIPGSSFGTYVASLDPVRDGKSTTSDSLCSLYIYKNDVEVSRQQTDGSFKQELEPGKLVAWWCGRFNDLNDTHERCQLLLEMYDARCVVENNVTQFIQHMIQRHQQKYLIRSDELMFLKELNMNASVFQDYGWRNTGTTFKLKMLPYAASVMSEELDRQVDEHGTTTVTRYGIERFPDVMLFEEVKAWREGLNVDRLVSFAALMTYVNIQRSNRAGEFIRRELAATRPGQLLSRPAGANLKERNPFRHVGQAPEFDPVTLSYQQPKSGRARTPFRNLR